MQVGDTYTVKNYVNPEGFGFVADIKSQNDEIITISDNIVTAVKEGNTNLILSCGDYSELLPVYVGTQIVNSESLSFKNRSIKDIIFCNAPTTLQIGEEWAIEGIGVNSEGVLWDWYYDENALIYYSDNSYVATVEFGVVTARNPGTATIIATNIDGTVKKSYVLTVEEENRWWENLTDEETYSPSAIESTFEGFQSAIDYAVENGYKKILFPQAEYILVPTTTPIELPENMCLDFNKSVIKMAQNNDLINSKTAYTTFNADSKDNIIIMNGTFYGECYYDWSTENPCPYHVEHELMFNIVGGKRGRMINCEVSYGPGFSVNCGHGYLGNTRKAFKLDNVKAGGINEDGTNNDDSSYTFRSADYIALNTLDKRFPWTLGNFQGYGGYAYLYSRLFSIWFFDASYRLIKCYKYLRQFAFYELPSGAEYCKIEIYQTSAPASADPDYNGIAHLMSRPYSFGFRFENCTFRRSVSTGLLAMGDMTILDNCYFEDCGIIDPAASIDWEDGGQATHSCIVRHCTFRRTILGGAAAGWCALRSVNSSSLVWHDNVFDKTSIDIRSNTEWFRFYRNWFNTTIGLNSKYDAVFAGNALLDNPTIGLIEGSNSQIFMADNTICVDVD